MEKKDKDNNRVVDPREKQIDGGFDFSLRPKTLFDYVGQEKIKRNLEVSLQAARKRGEPLDHVLFYGPPGLGKTTLAHVIAHEMDANIKITSGPALERSGDLAAILTNLEEGDILFIDEIHRLNKIIEEILYPAMEDHALDIIIGKGPTARTLRLQLPRFSIVGATTKFGSLSSPLRDRFGNIYHLDFYTEEEICRIIDRSAKLLTINIHDSAIKEIARSSRRTPRVANRLLKRVRDLSDSLSGKNIDGDLAKETLTMLEIDHLGLDDMDRKILLTIIDKFNGGPVGVNTIAAATAEEVETIENVYEPFLLQLGFLDRTGQGRRVTPLAYEHLGRPFKAY